MPNSSRITQSLPGTLVALAVPWLLLAGSCAPGQPAGTAQPAATRLASLTDSDVRVEVALEGAQAGQAVLAATFTPLEEGLHLYGKDLPRAGVGGVGRPTLLELTPASKMQARGTLADSVAAETEVLVPDTPALAVYPPGAVTLRLAVALPAGPAAGVDDQVSVTYMACNAQGCRRPVVGKVINVHLPGGLVFTPTP